MMPQTMIPEAVAVLEALREFEWVGADFIFVLFLFYSPQFSSLFILA